jgi:hypothetical protein
MDTVDTSNTQAIESAENALAKGQWSEAFELLNKTELAADGVAQNLLGWLYLTGKGVKKNPEIASACLKKAVANDCWQARCNLARMYQYGIGIERNLQQAFRLYKQAAEGKDAEITEREAKQAFNNSYLDECWIYCKQWASHLERKPLEGYSPNSQQKERILRSSLFQLRYIRELITNNPTGWFHFTLVLLCRALVVAIVIAEVLPLIPGFYFSGSIKDSVFLALIFCIVNTVVTVSGMIAIPLYIVCVAILIYLGCDLPIIGLVLTTFFAVLGNFFSKLVKEDRKEKISDEFLGASKENRLPSLAPVYGEESFQPSSLREKPRLFRTVVAFGAISVVLFNAISVRILTDFFPNVFVVHGWTTTFLVAIALTAVNYLFGRLMQCLETQYYMEGALALEWLS